FLVAHFFAYLSVQVGRNTPRMQFRSGTAICTWDTGSSRLSVLGVQIVDYVDGRVIASSIWKAIGALWVAGAESSKPGTRCCPGASKTQPRPHEWHCQSWTQ